MLGLLLAQTSNVKRKALQVPGLLLAQTSDVKCKALQVLGFTLSSNFRCQVLGLASVIKGYFELKLPTSIVLDPENDVFGHKSAIIF